MISPSNRQFKFIDDKYLICKSDPNNDEFDNILSASRDIKEISIPSNIKIISSCAFAKSKNLTTVEFEANSNLQTIESYTFSFSSIKGIFIPSKVSEMQKDAFGFCAYLQIIEISEESKLESIPLCAFNRFSEVIVMIPLMTVLKQIFEEKKLKISWWEMILN